MAEVDVEKIRERVGLATEGKYRHDSHNERVFRKFALETMPKLCDEVGRLNEQLRRSATVCPQDGCMLWRDHAGMEHATVEDVRAAFSAERELRLEWWLNHGCAPSALYGDDGEMQCSGECGIVDFRRTPIEELKRLVTLRRMLKGRG